MPRPCASLTPKRIERNAEARNVVYIVRAIAVSIVPWSASCLQRPQAGDVRLGFLDRAVGLLQLLPHGRRAAADGDVVRAEAVHQLVHQDVGEERVERDVLLVARRAARPSRSAAGPCWNFASCTFFSITRLVPFSLTTRSSFGRLKAAVCTPRLRVAGGEDDVDDADRRERAELRVAVARDRWAARSRGPAARAPNTCSFFDLGLVAHA